MIALGDPELVAREYAAPDRFQSRRHTATGWVRDDSEIELLAAVAEARPDRVLDAGCGDGFFTRAIAAPVVIGVDSSPAMVERSLARGVDAREADIHELPFDDGEFGVVVCSWVLYHLHDLERGLAELARVLRSGGRLVGLYNGEGHMPELWSRVCPEFQRVDDYDDALGRHFARVERRELVASTLWENRDDLQTYLGSLIEIIGPLEAPPEPYPFKVTRRTRLYVAEKA